MSNDNSSPWHRRSRFAKSVNGWFTYQLASWASLFFPVEVDKAMHNCLCEQFPDFPKRKTAETAAKDAEDSKHI